ncbi:T9SS-dependent choice-of-anchor J family protein [Chryseobacterium jejuense]|uniref:Por secretion system C-terminal sorting domain n=1 Tax=Chryseobacterium jejuense TaxID=445960 RepID=A0A2X2X126_CHRJE|nr:choice-of-anchor J domain-containing protein [Chryseobacterium jejuense]SDI21097.1 Por secretion system C-terminal sorting domain-containing protein [Chryseobacterium jejuense]SQB46706.1 Por secretion system C-terminal sorting domain [Chryseobacterium jejuense]
MKLKLLLGTLLLTAITAKAQVPTIHENFDNFTIGNTSFPQFGWSAIVAPMITIPGPPPVSPRMIVAGTTNKSVQSYSGTNPTGTSYLITPQIQSPTGDKNLAFTATLVASSPGTNTIQIGTASNPADMSTFVPVGNPINVTQVGVIQNISVNIPASSASYLVFKFTPTSIHTAVQIDDVVYDTVSSLGVSDKTFSKDNIKFAVNADNTALEFRGKDLKNIQIYSSAGQKVTEGKLNGQKFNINTLQTGIYYITMESIDGKIIQSKFIKK